MISRDRSLADELIKAVQFWLLPPNDAGLLRIVKSVVLRTAGSSDAVSVVHLRHPCDISYMNITISI